MEVYMENYCIGVDLGGTSTKLGIINTNGKLIKKWQAPTNTREAGRFILQDIIDLIKTCLSYVDIDVTQLLGVGVGVPGIVLEGGFVKAAVNLGWKDKKVKGELAQALKLPVTVMNDANAAALGEMWQGSGKGYRNLVMITLGTGIGAGIIIDGKRISGSFGGAGELGHMPIVTDETQRCNCGRTGCLEQAASATGIVKEALRLLRTSEIESSLRNIPEINARTVCEAAKKGDLLSREVLKRAVKYLGLAMAVTSSVLDPELYIIGGGVSAAGQFLLDMVKRYYEEQVLYLSKATEVRLASLGNEAGIYGAAKSVLIDAD